MAFSTLEQTTALYTATVEDASGNALPDTSLTTLTLTLYDVATGDIINSRNAQDVLNTNGVTVDGSGNLQWIMAPDDNIIVGSDRGEKHIALFIWTWAAGARRGSHQVEIIVENLTKVT